MRIQQLIHQAPWTPEEFLLPKMPDTHSEQFHLQLFGRTMQPHILAKQCQKNEKRFRHNFGFFVQTPCTGYTVHTVFDTTEIIRNVSTDGSYRYRRDCTYKSSMLLTLPQMAGHVTNVFVSVPCHKFAAPGPVLETPGIFGCCKERRAGWLQDISCC